MSIAGSIEATRELCADLDNLIELTKEIRAPVRALSLIEEPAPEIWMEFLPESGDDRREQERP